MFIRSLQKKIVVFSIVFPYQFMCFATAKLIWKVRQSEQKKIPFILLWSGINTENRYNFCKEDDIDVDDLELEHKGM